MNISSWSYKQRGSAIHGEFRDDGGRRRRPGNATQRAQHREFTDEGHSDHTRNQVAEG